MHNLFLFIFRKKKLFESFFYRLLFVWYRVHRLWKQLIVVTGMMVLKRQRHSFKSFVNNVKRLWLFLAPSSSQFHWICSLRYVIWSMPSWSKISFFCCHLIIGAWCGCNLLHGVGATQINIHIIHIAERLQNTYPDTILQRNTNENVFFYFIKFVI